MSATPWTPGPWVWDSRHGLCQSIGDKPGSTARLGATVLYATYEYDSGPDIVVVSEANARLIQHAPDMAEALECLAAMAAHFPTTQTYGTRVRSGPIYSVADVRLGEAAITVEDLHRARTLLARIRGDAP